MSDGTAIAGPRKPFIQSEVDSPIAVVATLVSQKKAMISGTLAAGKRRTAAAERGFREERKVGMARQARPGR